MKFPTPAASSKPTAFFLVFFFYSLIVIPDLIGNPASIVILNLFQNPFFSILQTYDRRCSLQRRAFKISKYWANGASDAMRKGAERSYGKPFADAEQKFYEKLFLNPNSQKINVVVGQTDAVCNLCKTFSDQSNTKFCSGNGSENDRAGLAEAKLEPGSYTLSELISRFRS